jgi:hypothetical protein
MSRSTGRVRPGQNITTAFSARAWNRAQDAADIVLGDRGQVQVGQDSPLARAPNIVLVRNDSDLPVPVGGCLRLSGYVVIPGEGRIDNEDPDEEDYRAREFIRQPVLTGDVVESLTDSIAVALEPVAVNAVGRFAAGGVFPCKVRVLNNSHRYATGRIDDVTQLVSASCGPVRLLQTTGAVGTEEDEQEPNTRWSLGQM